MADIDIKITDNSGKILELEKQCRERALEMIGLQAERYAKEGCPVDTGRLRNSITHATKAHAGKSYSYTFKEKSADGKHLGQTQETSTIGSGITEYEVVIGTNVPYAFKQETNESYHHTVGGAHFLKNAAGNHSDTYRKLIEMSYKGQK